MADLVLQTWPMASAPPCRGVSGVQYVISLTGLLEGVHPRLSIIEATADTVGALIESENYDALYGTVARWGFQGVPQMPVIENLFLNGNAGLPTYPQALATLDQVSDGIRLFANAPQIGPNVAIVDVQGAAIRLSVGGGALVGEKSLYDEEVANIDAYARKVKDGLIIEGGADHHIRSWVCADFQNVAMSFKKDAAACVVDFTHVFGGNNALGVGVFLGEFLDPYVASGAHYFGHCQVDNVAIGCISFSNSAMWTQFVAKFITGVGLELNAPGIVVSHNFESIGRNAPAAAIGLTISSSAHGSIFHNGRMTLEGDSTLGIRLMADKCSIDTTIIANNTNCTLVELGGVNVFPSYNRIRLYTYGGRVALSVANIGSFNTIEIYYQNIASGSVVVEFTGGATDNGTNRIVLFNIDNATRRDTWETPVRQSLAGVTLKPYWNYVHSGAAATATLPTGLEGRRVTVKNAGSGALTVQRNGTDTIFDTAAGQTSISMAIGVLKEFVWESATPQWVTS